MTGRTEHQFSLRFELLAGKSWRLTLRQQQLGTNGRRTVRRRKARLEGTPLVITLDQVLEVLRREGY